MDEVVQWFRNLRKENALGGFGDLDWDNLIQNINEKCINGDYLASFGREDLNMLGIKRLGPQKTILSKIKEFADPHHSVEGRTARLSKL